MATTGLASLAGWTLSARKIRATCSYPVGEHIPYTLSQLFMAPVRSQHSPKWMILAYVMFPRSSAPRSLHPRPRSRKFSVRVHIPFGSGAVGKHCSSLLASRIARFGTSSLKPLRMISAVRAISHVKMRNLQERGPTAANNGFQEIPPLLLVKRLNDRLRNQDIKEPDKHTFQNDLVCVGAQVFKIYG